MYAAVNGHHEVVKSILKNSADVEAKVNEKGEYKYSSNLQNNLVYVFELLFVFISFHSVIFL